MLSGIGNDCVFVVNSTISHVDGGGDQDVCELDDRTATSTSALGCEGIVCVETYDFCAAHANSVPRACASQCSCVDSVPHFPCHANSPCLGKCQVFSDAHSIDLYFDGIIQLNCAYFTSNATV